MKKRILTALLAIASVSVAAGFAQAAPKAKPAPKPVPQKITITLPEGYKDNKVAVKAGKPVALTFFLKSDAGCGDTVTVPAAKWKKDLKIGEKATVVYTPKKSGKLAFACGMDMMKGSLIVK